jgi:CBS domain-containing protein
MATCSDVMTREPVYCVPADPVAHAADLMRSHDVGSLPVIESGDSRKLVGIVTDRDLVVKVVAATRPVHDATVRDAMTADPVSCRADDDLDRAVSIMAERRVRRMPVVDADGRLVGIIAQADIASPVQQDARTVELVDAIYEPGAGSNA